MYMTLDTMATRYHLLPSEVLTKATTIDLYVMDRALRYRDMKQKANGAPLAKPVPNLTEAQMLEMVEAAKRSRDA